MDTKLCGQLVHRGTSVIALDQAGQLGSVEPLGPLGCPAGPFTGRSGEVQPPVGPDGPAQRGGGRVRERSHEDHQMLQCQTLASFAFHKTALANHSDIGATCWLPSNNIYIP